MYFVGMRYLIEKTLLGSTSLPKVVLPLRKVTNWIFNKSTFGSEIFFVNKGSDEMQISKRDFEISISMPLAGFKFITNVWKYQTYQ